MYNAKKPNFHIVITDVSSDMDELSKDKIDKTFDGLFGDLSRKVSSIEAQGNVEMIYEVQTPVFRDELIAKEFYESLEVLLDELSEFHPHFTQFKKAVM